MPFGSLSSKGAGAASILQLRIIAGLPQLGSVSGVAAFCGMSQPAVSNALSMLERQIGCVLVDRGAHGSVLNRDGLLFRDRVERFFEIAEQAVGDAASASGADPALLLADITSAQIRAIATASDLGTIASTAGQIGITTAAVAKSIHALEALLGTPFLTNGPEGQSLNATGRQFGRRLRLAFREISLAVDDLAARHARDAQKLSVGAMPFGSSAMLASVLTGFAGRHPAIEVCISVGNPAEMMRRLRNGAIDLVIGLLPMIAEDDLRVEPLATTRFMIVARRGHPLTGQSAITRAMVLDYPWIIGFPETHHRRCFDDLRGGQTLTHPPLMLDSLQIASQVLAESDRLAIMTALETSRDDALQTIPFDAGPFLPAIGIVSRADHLPSANHAEFVTHVRHTLRTKYGLGRRHSAAATR